MIYQVFDIDNTLVDFGGVTPYPNVLNHINSLDLNDNRLIFLTARYDLNRNWTQNFLKETLGHENFTLVCREMVEMSIPRYKLKSIKVLFNESPQELHFYDDDPENLRFVDYYRKKYNIENIFLYLAHNGILNRIPYSFNF